MTIAADLLSCYQGQPSREHGGTALYGIRQIERLLDVACPGIFRTTNASIDQAVRSRPEHQASCAAGETKRHDRSPRQLGLYALALQGVVCPYDHLQAQDETQRS